jgi:hypothetical protein
VELVQTTPNSTVTAHHRYSTEGLMSAYVQAWDGFSIPVTSDSLLIDVSYGTSTINLAQGWNLFSIPRGGSLYRASTLGLAMGDVVVRWNETLGEYDSAFIIGISPPGMDFVIEGSMGYWIYVGASKSITVMGPVPEEKQYRQIVVPTGGGGWALVGFESLNSTRRASDLPSMYSVPGGLIIIVEWDPWLKEYNAYNPGWPPFLDFTLVVGQAYWVWCTASGVLSYYP